jgi:hypothetical protein
MSRKNYNNISSLNVRPVHFFILSYVIVGYQKPLDVLLGYSNDVNSYISIDVMNYCLLLATVGLCFFLLGYSFIGFRNTNKKNFDYKSLRTSPSLFSKLTTILIVVFLVVVPKQLLFGGYSSELVSEASSFTYLSSWISLFISAYFIQIIYNIKAENKKIKNVWHFVRYVGGIQNSNILIYSLIVLNIGDRGPLIIISLAYYFAYLCSVRKSIKIKYLTAIFVGAALFFSLLGESKKHRGDNDIVERLETTINEREDNDNSILPQTSELAGSFKCLAYSTVYVPFVYDFNYGLYQLNYLLSPIPFVGRIVKMPGSSSKAVTFFIQGDDAQYGNGTSCLADFYLDFGPIGIILGLFLWGLLLRYFENVILGNDIASCSFFCIAFYFCIHTFYMPRAAIFFSFKYAVWLAIIFRLYHRYLCNKEL